MNETLECRLCPAIVVITPAEDQHLNEVWIGEGIIASENGEPDYHGLIAQDAEYPEEGAIALEDQPHDQ